MTRAEATAFNAGVRAVLDLAQRIAERVVARTNRHHHDQFAVEALTGLAAEGEALLLPCPTQPSESHLDVR